MTRCTPVPAFCADEVRGLQRRLAADVAAHESHVAGTMDALRAEADGLLQRAADDVGGWAAELARREAELRGELEAVRREAQAHADATRCVQLVVVPFGCGMMARLGDAVAEAPRALPGCGLAEGLGSGGRLWRACGCLGGPFVMPRQVTWHARKDVGGWGKCSGGCQLSGPWCCE